MRLIGQLILIALLLDFNLSWGQTTYRALFLGNSYTYVNDLPQIISSIASSMGDSLIYDSNTPGGYTLEGHASNPTSLGKIMAGNWDFVVLQEQSQRPSFPISQVELEVFPYARQLDSAINATNPCAETMFYMTWGRKNGDASNCAVWPPVCTYEGMDSLIRLRYLMMADSNDAVVSPVGAVWRYIRQNYQQLELYQVDESHPSEIGSYAAACCFYTSMFRKDPLSITYDFTLDPTDAANIRTATKVVVYDSLLSWHIGEYDPQADFSFQNPTGTTYDFSNSSLNATAYFWDFGDGDTTSLENPTHTYSANGTFTVTLHAKHCQASDSVSHLITVSGVGIKERSISDGLQVFPNPSKDIVIISHPDLSIHEIELIDSRGKSVPVVIQNQVDRTTLMLPGIASGLYLIRIHEKGGATILRKVVVE